MASKVLKDSDIEQLMAEVQGMDKAKLATLAEEFTRKEAEAREKRKQYHQKKTPEQKAKQREYMKTRSAKERERRKLVLAAARELGLIPQGAE